jgi:acetylglutamate synthase
VIDTWAAKVFKAVSRMSGRGNQSAVVVIASEYSVQEDEARKILQDYVNSMYKSLNMLINKTTNRM